MKFGLCPHARHAMTSSFSLLAPPLALFCLRFPCSYDFSLSIKFSLNVNSFHFLQYRGGNKGLQILLSRAQAGPGRTVKQEQEQISRNHVQTFISPSVHVNEMDTSISGAMGRYSSESGSSSSSSEEQNAGIGLLERYKLKGHNDTDQ